MIRNQREYARSRQVLADLHDRLAAAEQQYAGNPVMLKIQQTQLGRTIGQIEQDLAAYEALRVGRVARRLHARDPESGRVAIGPALVQMRLAARMSQEELARRLGTQQPNIARWERNDQAAYTLQELQRLADELGWDVDVVFARRPRKARRGKPRSSGRAG